MQSPAAQARVVTRTANTSFTAPFTAGTNVIELFYNNNFAGINTGNGGLTGGPGSLAFDGNITFGLGTAVPEPEAWALMIGGLAFAGMAARRRRASVRVTYA